MTNIKYTDADSATRYSYSTKAGTIGDPDLSPESIVDKLTTLAGYVDTLETLLTATNTAIAATNTALSTLGGYQDGIEALIGTTNSTLATTNTNLTTLAGYTDTLETLIAATNTALTTLAGYVDGLETLVGTSNTTLASILAKQPSLGTAGTPSANVITVQGASSMTPLSVTSSPTSRAAATTNVHAPTSNAAAILTYTAAGAGVSHAISGIAWSYSAAPTGGNLKVEDSNGVTVFSVDITAAGPGFIPFQAPLKGATNTAMIITLAAGGSGVTGKVNALGKWTE